MERPLCEDRFVLSKEYDIHIKKHLEESQGIDIKVLKMVMKYLNVVCVTSSQITVKV